jgi:hypothetical protein
MQRGAGDLSKKQASDWRVPHSQGHTTPQAFGGVAAELPTGARRNAMSFRQPAFSLHPHPLHLQATLRIFRLRKELTRWWDSRSIYCSACCY